MKRTRKFLDVDVLTAARERIKHCLDIYDSFAVMFSGGKDSLVVLHLVREIAAERGINQITVLHNDIEFVPDTVVDFVSEYQQRPWVNMIWVCHPEVVNGFVLGQQVRFQRWDPAREPMHPKPTWAVTPEPCSGGFNFDEIASRYLKGSVCLFNGVRAAESIIRLRSIMKKGHESYITKGDHKRITLAKPIYDWSQDDVLYYLASSGIPWCESYDRQHHAGRDLRVGSPVADANAKKLDQDRYVDPVFYDKLMRALPELEAQSRYWNDYKDYAHAVESRYAQMGWDGIYAYINEQIDDPKLRVRARYMITRIEPVRKKTPEQFPVDYVLRQLVNGVGHQQGIWAAPQREIDARKKRGQS